MMEKILVSPGLKPKTARSVSQRLAYCAARAPQDVSRKNQAATGKQTPDLGQERETKVVWPLSQGFLA